MTRGGFGSRSTWRRIRSSTPRKWSKSSPNSPSTSPRWRRTADNSSRLAARVVEVGPNVLPPLTRHAERLDRLRPDWRPALLAVGRRSPSLKGSALLVLGRWSGPLILHAGEVAEGEAMDEAEWLACAN